MKTEELNLALETICQKIGGDWLLLGGSLVRIDIDPNRGTHDLDIVKIPLPDSLQTQIDLVTEMKKIGLSPEQVNSAVVYFLKQLPNWENETRLLKSFSNGRILRPTLTLFAMLKLSRGTPIDLEDLRKATQKWGIEEFDLNLFNQWATSEILQKAKSLGIFNI